MRVIPYWLDIERPGFPVLDHDRTADAVVIGAGIAGLKTARCLARLGWEVVVLEGARVGEGASSGSATSGNEYSIAPITMATDEADPLERLARIVASTRHVKESGAFPVRCW